MPLLTRRTSNCRIDKGVPIFLLAPIGKLGITKALVRVAITAADDNSLQMQRPPLKGGLCFLVLFALVSTQNVI